MTRPLLGLPLGPLLVGLFALTALFGPALSPHAPDTIDLAHAFELPSPAHPLGTGDNGVDLAAMLLHGARLSAVVSLSAVGLAVAFGALLGILAGYRGGRVDHVITGASDLVQAFPSIVLNVTVLALVAEPDIIHLVLSLSLTGWVLFARLARAQTLLLREMEYVTAARALGASETRVLTRHILPNLAGPLVVQATGALGMTVLAESTLSFLGLGPGSGVSWGALLDQGSSVLLRFPHVALVAGGAIALAVLGFNLSGDYLRDRLDR